MTTNLKLTIRDVCSEFLDYIDVSIVLFETNQMIIYFVHQKSRV